MGKNTNHYVKITWGHDGSVTTKPYTTRGGAKAEYERIVKSGKIWCDKVGYTNNYTVEFK